MGGSTLSGQIGTGSVFGEDDRRSRIGKTDFAGDEVVGTQAATHAAASSSGSVSNFLANKQRASAVPDSRPTMTATITRGEYVLLLPEDAVNLDSPSYGIVARVTPTTVTVTGIPNSQLQWTTPRRTATERRAPAVAARGLRPGVWLRRAVAARLRSAWVHGQVVALAPDTARVVVRHGSTTSVCAIPELTVVDPVTCLLLWDVEVPRSRRVSQLRTLHATLLDRLLGSPDTPDQPPSRDIATILADIVPRADHPAGDTVRTWIDQATGIDQSFPLQHAVDFVYVTEGNAVHIPDELRERIGASFSCPPATGRPSMDPEALAGHDESASQSDSFFADLVTSAEETGTGRTPMDSQGAPTPIRGDTADAHARVVRALAGQPELLAEYLEQSTNAVAPPAKRRRTTTDNDLAGAPKYGFQPSPTQSQLHLLLMASRLAGTCAHDFLDGLISHASVQFAPHPGVLIRLYDFQFGTRGLSIMHLAFMDRVEKMTWVQARHANMQNFSYAVALPAPRIPTSSAEVVSAISSLHTYCASFASPEVVDLVQRIHAFALEEVGSAAWAPSDLPHFVYWVDGILESFRAAAVRDIAGGCSRSCVQDTVNRTNPELQATIQLLTQRKLREILQERPTPGLSRGREPVEQHQSRVVQQVARRPEQDTVRLRGGQRSSSERPQYLPQQHGRELCLRSLSRRGCPGVVGAPSQCIYPDRAHFTPTTLPEDARAFIQRRLGGLAPAYQQL